jgi:hypothetical protein
MQMRSRPRPENLLMPARLFAILLLSLSFTLAPWAPAQPPAAAPRPRLVTLQADKIALSKALSELTRQTGVRVEDRRGGGAPEIRLDLRNVPFWQALETVADASGSVVYLYPRGGQIALVKRTGLPPPVSHDGAFRSSLKKVVLSRDLETDAHTCVVFLEVAWEPKVQPLLLETRPQNLRLVDDKGKEVPVPADGSSMAPVDGRTSLVSEVTLPAPPRSARAIGLLEGTLNVVGPSKMLTFTFDTLDQLEKAAAGDALRRQEREGVVCQVSRVVLARDRWTVQITLDYPTGNKQLESYQSWVVNNELALESKDGKKRLVTRDYVLETSSTRRAVLSYHFRDRDGQTRGRGEDWRLTYRTPAAIIEWPVRFSFKDVRLP